MDTENKMETETGKDLCDLIKKCRCYGILMSDETNKACINRGIGCAYRHYAEYGILVPMKDRARPAVLCSQNC